MEATRVCTISREGTPTMNAMVRRTLGALAEAGHAIAAVHLEARDTALSDAVRSASPDAIVRRRPGGANPIAAAVESSRLLFAGVRAQLRRAVEEGARALVYLEGDKHSFAEHVRALAAPVLAGDAGLALAVRSEAGFAAFPWTQRVIERRYNRRLARRTGVETDYLYGPRAFSPTAARLLDAYPSDDWGVIMVPVVAGLQRGLRLARVGVPGHPPPDYMRKYDWIMRSPPAHAAWRLVQLRAIDRASRQPPSGP